MNIALIRSPFINAEYPPDIGLGYLCSSLTERGHVVNVYDLNIEYFNEVDDEQKRKWLDKDVYSEHLSVSWDEARKRIPATIDRVLAKEPSAIGFSVWSGSCDFSLELARRFKEADPKVTIIFGGPECYPLHSGLSFIRQAEVDLVVYGEGEITLNVVLDSLSNRRLPSDLPGTIVKGPGGEPIVNLPGPQIHPDELPIPDFRQFPLHLYSKGNSLFFMNSRGCINRCMYCQVPGMYKYRSRDARKVFDEIVCQMQRHPGVTRFECGGPALNTHLKELSRFCDLLIESGTKVAWGGNAFIHPDMDRDLIGKMKKAGCCSLVFGIESASLRILERMGKRYQPSDIARIIRDCRNSRIGVNANFIVGFPGETDDDFEETCRFVRENAEYIDMIGSRSDCRILPYSSLYDTPARFGVSFAGSKCTSDHISDWTDTRVPSNGYAGRQAKVRRFFEVIREKKIGNDYGR